MRLVIPHSGNMWGGTERALESLAQAQRWGVPLETHFSLCFEGRMAGVLREIGHQPTMLGEVRLMRPDLVLRARRRLAALLAEIAPDLMFTQSAWSHALFAPVARRQGLPVALWGHDALSGQNWLERLAGRSRPALIVCNSHFTEQAATSVFPNVPSTIVRYPLALGTTARSSRADVRALHNVDADTTVIINVARMEPYKGQLLLIDALAAVRSARPWACWIVGGAQRDAEVKYQDLLRAQVRSLGLESQVRFLGQQTDVDALLRAADVFCHPNSGAEPFGIALIEAMNAGLPVVATDLGGPSEIVTPACGALVADGDRTGLSANLTALIDDAGLRQSLGAAGRQRANELCDARTQLRQLHSALTTVVDIARTAA